MQIDTDLRRCSALHRYILVFDVKELFAEVNVFIYVLELLSRD